MTAPIVWHIKGHSYLCEVLDQPCPECGRQAVTELPPPVQENQRDETTHVCNPGLGGCNWGFTIDGRHGT